MQPAVSIITVYFNTPEELLELYASIQRYLPPEECEWIIADNNSSVDLSSKLTEVTYVRLESNLGFAKANNLAAEKAHAPYLFFLNPDTILLENPLPPLLNAMKSAGVAGPQVLNSDGSIQLSFGPSLTIFNEAYQRFLTRKEKSGVVQRWMRSKTRNAFETDYVSGCALMISAELYRNLGGFDEQFFLYEEDVDLCKRVRKRGLRVFYVPDAKIQHARNRSVQQAPEKVRQEYRKSQLYYYQKHNSVLQQWMLKMYLALKGSR